MIELAKELMTDLLYNIIYQAQSRDQLTETFGDLFEGDIQVVFNSWSKNNIDRMAVVFIVHEDATERQLAKLDLVFEFLTNLDATRGVRFDSIKIAKVGVSGQPSQ